MNAYECYTTYVAMKLHFTKLSYDYFQYNGSAKNVTPDTFDKRKDARFFYRIAKMRRPKEILLASMVDNPHKWIGDIIENGEKTRSAWKNRIQSLGYLFEQEISKLDHCLANNMKVRHGEHPVLLKEYLAGRISIETLLIILDLTKVTYKYWNKKMSYDPIWKELAIRVKKYKPFLKYEKSKYRKIMIEYFH